VKHTRTERLGQVRLKLLVRLRLPPGRQLGRGPRLGQRVLHVVAARKADDVGHDGGVERVRQRAVVDPRHRVVRVRHVDVDGAAAERVQVAQQAVGVAARDDEVVEGRAGAGERRGEG
jgi:hypothetical protein